MASRFLITGGGSVTWDASDTSIWSATSGGATGASVPGSGDTVTMDANSGGGTVTMGAGYNPTIQSLAGGSFTGTFDMSVNNNNLTCTAVAGFNFSGSGARTLLAGSGTLTLSDATAAYTIATDTNATITTTNWNIAFTAVTGNANRTFTNSGGRSYASLTVASRTGAYSRLFTITGGTTFTTATFGSGLSIALANSQTWTTWNATGTSAHPTFFSPVTPGGAISVTTTTASLDWIVARDMNVSSPQNATNSIDLGNNTNITFSIPSGSGNRLSPGIG